MTRCSPASGNFWGYKRKKIQYQVEHANKEQDCTCLLENKNSLCIAQILLRYYLKVVVHTLFAHKPYTYNRT